MRSAYSSNELSDRNQLVCYLVMSWNNAENKFRIRIERGSKPRLKIDETGRNVHAVIPKDTNVNWPPVRADLNNGYFVLVQRLQQQYKIIIQHTHEKKPDVTVYSASSPHDNELKTTVKEINTQIPEMDIAGPNLDVVGNVKCHNITFESTVGTMHINARVLSNRLDLLAQNIVVATEALLSTNKIRVISRKVQLDGRIYPHEASATPRHFSAVFDASLVHLGVDGCIGESNDKENNKSKKNPNQKVLQIVADVLSLQITGSLANYGKIVATERTELQVGESVLSLSDGSLDSAGRGYDALKEIRGIRSNTMCTPSSASLQSAISAQNTAAAAQLIENGVDLNDRVNNRATKRMTLRQSAIKKYREQKEQSMLNQKRADITLINALFAVHDWRRGSISSNTILAVIGKRCDDCAQFAAKELQLKIGASATVEKDSIWNCSWVELEVGQDVTISGQVKHKTLIINSEGTIRVTQTAIINHEMFARLNCKSFDCDGIWSIGENFVIETKKNITFYANSYIESEKIELVCGENCIQKGSWQIGTAWIKISDLFEIGESAKIFVDETATVGANRFNSHGFFNAVQSCQMHVKEDARFSSISKLECKAFNLVCESSCVLGGIWVVDMLHAYIRKDLVTLEGAKSATFTKATVTTGGFRNCGHWQVERDGVFTVGKIEQTPEAILFIKQTFDLVIHSESATNWDGRIVCSRFLLRCLKNCQYDGLLRANEAEIMLPYGGESQMHAAGQWDILDSALTIKGNSNFLPHTPRKRHPYPAFILSGRLSATALVAPFSSVLISEDATMRLIGISSPNPDVEFNVLITAGALTTGKGSTIVSLAENPYMEGIICAETWYHEGQIRFQAEEVYLLTNSWIQKGRLTNSENKQNHLKIARIVIEELFLNRGTLACDSVYIVGEGSLENHGRIYASENLDIRLKNFNNDEGCMESKNSMKLLSASKEWTRLSGSIKAKTNFDLCAHKLEFAVKDASGLSRGDRLSFSARSELLLATSIEDENRRLALGCAALRSVILNSTIDVDRLEVLLGGPDNEVVFLHLREAADVLVNNLIINGHAKELRIYLDGSLRCGRLSVASGFEKVVVGGKGHIEINTVQADSSHVVFDIYQIIALGDITADYIEILPESLFRLRPYGEAESSTILTPTLNIHGNLLVEGKLFVSASKGNELFIFGTIVGSSPDSELYIEGSKVRLSGLIGSLKFLEIFAKESLTITNGKHKNVTLATIESTELHLAVDIEDCFQYVLNGEVVNIHGKCLSNTGNSTFSLFSNSVQSTVDFENIESVSLACSRTSSIEGSFENIKKLELDSKWLMINSEMRKCGDVTCSAWSLHVKSLIEAANIYLSSLGVIMIDNVLSSPELRIVALFVLAPTVCLPACSIDSLALMTSYMEVPPQGLSYLHFMFSEDCMTPKLSISEVNAWKDAAIMMKDRFNSTTIDVDEMLLGLKYLNDLQPVRVSLSNNSNICVEVTKMMEKFQKSPINVFSLADLVAIIYSARNSVQASVPEKTTQKKKKRNSDGQLYEVLSTFRSSKYGKESRSSTDSDGGYASRSSSEDLDVKERRSATSPSIRLTPSPMFGAHHMEEIDKKLEDMENTQETTMEEINESFLEEEEELAEFEELEQEIEDAESGIVRTDYIICRDKRIQLARMKQKISTCLSNRPKTHFPIMRASSSNDLVMKRLKVKNALSSLDLRSFGSEISLVSLDFSQTPDVGSPVHYPSSPLQRSRIPRGSFRSPQKVSVCK